jgi:hypothetical protein
MRLSAVVRGDTSTREAEGPEGPDMQLLLDCFFGFGVWICTVGCVHK